MQTFAREVRALEVAGQTLARAKRRLLVLDRPRHRDHGPRLQVQPVYEWLLETPGAG